MEERRIKMDYADPENLDGAERTALMVGTGMTYEEMRRPKVAIFNTFSMLNPGHIHLNPVAEEAYKGVYEAGGMPFHLNGTNICDGFAVGPYALPSRDLLVNDIELMCEANYLDAAVLIGTCDKILPALLMAAGRINIPSIIITGGYMAAGNVEGIGDKIDYIDIGISRSKYIDGKITKDKFDEVVNSACSGAGACAMMGTANTMAIITETIGMSLPGNSTTAARSPKLLKIARRAGQEVMRMWRDNIKPRDIITVEAVTNALKVCMAVGGSANTIIHVPAVATETELNMNCSEVYAKASQEIPLLIGIRPNDEQKYNMQDFHEAGGLSALLSVMKDCLYLEGMTVTGKTMRENIAESKVLRPDVIHSLDNPISHEGGLVLCKGTLATEGAYVKQSAVPRHLMKHRGPAHCFNSQQDAIDALREGKIKAGEVVIIRYIGVKAGPNTAYFFTSALKGTDLGDKCATITDGRLSGAAQGASFQYCTPEAAALGPLTIVRDGDIIDYDIAERRLDLCLPQAEIDKRIAEFELNLPKKNGWLGIYQRCVSSVMRGAVLVEPKPID